MMWTLLSPRVWIAVAVAVALAGSHWKAYVVGKNTIQQEWNAAITAQALETVKASEAARVKEKTLNLSVERVRHELIKNKAARAADAVLNAGIMRDLEAALSSAGSNTPAAGGTDADPRYGIVAECASALTTLDEAAKRLAGQTAALQGYTVSVCVSQLPN